MKMDGQNYNSQPFKWWNPISFFLNEFQPLETTVLLAGVKFTNWKNRQEMTWPVAVLKNVFGWSNLKGWLLAAIWVVHLNADTRYTKIDNFNDEMSI